MTHHKPCNEAGNAQDKEQLDYGAQSPEWRAGYDEAEQVYHAKQYEMRRELRLLRAEQPADSRSWVAAVDETMARAVAKHPAGPDGMRSLAEEVGEVASALRREGRERVRAELIDVAVIALRWWEQLGKETD